MKLLYIQNLRIPTEKAHGIHIMKMCEAFASRGDIEVALVVPRRFNKIKKDPFDYYGSSRIFKLKKLPCLDLIPLDRLIGHLGLWIESITFSFFVFWYLLFQKADIIYTRDKFLLPLSLFRKNLAFEAHTFPRNYFLYSFFLKRTKKIIVITQQLKILFSRGGVQESNILIAPDGVDLENFNIKESKEECRSKLNLARDKKIVLYTGHLYKWKGATVLLDVARKLQDVLFIFVGGTEKDIASFKQKAGSLDNIIIAGHRPYQEIPRWLKAADVLVLPNSGKADISKHWTSPMKMFEYMAAKKPIVASNLPSIKEILNKDNAILVEPDSSGALVLGIKTALQNSQLSDKISGKAFEDVKEHSWERRVENILNFLEYPT